MPANRPRQGSRGARSPGSLVVREPALGAGLVVRRHSRGRESERINSNLADLSYDAVSLDSTNQERRLSLCSVKNADSRSPRLCSLLDGVNVDTQVSAGDRTNDVIPHIGLRQRGRSRGNQRRSGRNTRT